MRSGSLGKVGTGKVEVSADVTSRHRRGITLLEVILSVAILGLAVSAMTQLLSLGTRTTRATEDVITAQLLCESKITEILIGLEPFEETSETPFETDPKWLYSVIVEEGEFPDLQYLEVSVWRENTPKERALTLYRWATSPDIELLEELEEEADTTEADTTEESTGGGSAGGGNQNAF